MSSTFFIIAGVLVLILLIAGVVMSSNSERNLVEDRLGRYLEEDDDKGKESDTSYVTEWVNRRVEKSTGGDKVKRALARADLKLKVAEYYGLVFASIFGIASSQTIHHEIDHVSQLIIEFL